MTERLRAEANEMLASVASILDPGALAHMGAFFDFLRTLSDNEPDVDLDRVRALHHELWREFLGWELSVTADPRVGLGLCWWVMANRQAHTAFTVSETSHPLDAMPNVRSALEHALGLVWLSRTTDTAAIDSVLSRWLEDMMRSVTHWPDEAQKAEMNRLVVQMRDDEELPAGPGEARPGSFWWLARRLGVTNQVYPYYPYLSGYCHPTLESLMAVMAFEPGAMRVHKQPVRTAPGGTPILWAVQCQCWSGLALDRMLPDGLPFVARLEGIAASISLPMVSELFPASGSAT